MIKSLIKLRFVKLMYTPTNCTANTAPVHLYPPAMLGHLLSVPALLAPSQPAPGRAAVAGSSFWSDAWTNAELQGSTWRLKLDLGREEWSASGARLPLSLEVCFTREPVSGGDLLWSVEEPSCCPAKRLLVTS